MSIEDEYLTLIEPFAQRVFDPLKPPQTKWKIEPFNVLRSLLRLLDNPDAIYQSCFGLCGQAAFLRAWAYRDPVAVAKFAIDLYTNGNAKIGDYPISASGDQLECPWMILPQVPDPKYVQKGKWGCGNQITESVWMICGALAATEDNTLEHLTLGGRVPPLPISKFSGYPASDLSTYTLPSELKRWLQKTNCYPDGVDDNTQVVGGKSLSADTAITNSFGDDVDVFLCINANMLHRAIITPNLLLPSPSDFPLSNFPDHYVMLKERVTQSGDTLTMKIWTWGGNYTVQISVNDFNAAYYGSIVAHAHASTERRALNVDHLNFNAIQNQRIYYSQNNSLHFEWEVGDTRTEWFELQRVGTKRIPNLANNGEMLPRDVLHRVWNQRGAKEHKFTMQVQDPGDPHGTRYEIVACHAALRPYDCDPFRYNQYDSVQCNVKDVYLEGGYQFPLCETQTTHFRLRYYGYPHSKQIPDGLDPNTTYLKPHNNETIQFAGETIGFCYAYGSTVIIQNGALILVNSDQKTPLYVEKIVVWLEYFYHLLGHEPHSLDCVKTGKMIEITIGDFQAAVIAAYDTLKVGIDAPAADDDMPGICLKALFLLEFAQTTGIWPQWIFPPYVSQLTVVQTRAKSIPVPDGYADFHSSLKPCEYMIAYDAQWIVRNNEREPLQKLIRSNP